MPFQQGTTRGHFGKSRPDSLVPPEKKLDWWDQRLMGAFIPEPSPHEFTTRQKYGIAAVAASIICAPIAIGVLADSDYVSTSKGCVDEKGMVVDESNCRTTHTGNRLYRHHYGGSYRIGSYPTGGSYNAPSPSSSVRGFFGRVGHSFGAGG